MLKTYLAWAGAVLLCAAVLVLLWPVRTGSVLNMLKSPAPGSDPELEAVRAGRTILTYWDRSQGHEFDMRRDLINEFNTSQDKIYVRTISIGWRIEKLLTAISSGAPPDLCSLEGMNLSFLGYQNCFLPLEDWMATQPHLKPEDFMPHARDIVTFNGHMWAIPTMTDSYCLLWSKSAFRRAGLDPEKPPKTMQELEDYARILTVSASTEGISQIGFLPWLPWDFSYMWGGFFGGEWFDKDRTKVVGGDDPKIIASYAWQGSWVKRDDNSKCAPYALPKEVAEEFYAGFSAGGAYFSATNPFYTGKVAMITEGEWQCTFIPKYAPNLDWGVAPIPQPDGAPPRSFSPSCVMDAIPAGSRHVEEAKQFLSWFYSPRPNGGVSPASDYCFMIHNIPPRPSEASQERFVGDPKFKVFVNELLTKPVLYYPSVPVGQFFSDGVSRAREFVIFGKDTPQKAVKDLQDDCNKQWQRVKQVVGD